MAELDTITLGELPTVSEIGENDTFLIARGGRMKQVSPSLIGGGMTVFELVSSEEDDPPKGTKAASGSASGATMSTIATTREIFDALPNAIFVADFSDLGETSHMVARVMNYGQYTEDVESTIYRIGLFTGGSLLSLYSTSEDSVMTDQEPGLDSGAGTEMS